MIPSRLTVVRGVEALVAAVMTVTVLPRVGLPLDLVLVLVVAVGLAGGSQVGAGFGLAAGLLLDLVPPGSAPLGLGALVYAAIGAGAGLLNRSLRASVLLPVVCVLAAAAAVQLLRFLVSAASRQGFDAGQAALTLVVTTLVGALLVPPVVRLEQHLTARGMA